MSQDLEETALWNTDSWPATTSSRRAWLTVITGSDAGRVYPLEPGSYLIGRSPEADIQVSDQAISRHHTTVCVGEDGTATVMDCASKNGTMLGSCPLTSEASALRDGSKLQIGGALVLRFSFRDQLDQRYERNLYDSANHDHLTGAFNKRHFENLHQQEFRHAQREKRPISLVLFDLDDFKRINDTLGHAAGDHVLREITRMFSEELRERELLARYGGEEFVILMHHAELPAALLLAERLRRLLNSAGILWRGQRIPVTASFGVACSTAARSRLPEQLFETADDGLYRAKRAGKNRVCGTGG